MKILIQTPFDNLPEEGFRPERYAMMAAAFKAAGHEVNILTADFNHGRKCARALKVPTSAGLISTPPYSSNVSLRRVFSHLVYARRLRRHLEDLPQPDLVISAVPTLSAASVLLSYARRIGVPFVLDIQDAWPETFARLLPRAFAWAGNFLFAPLHYCAARLYREADLVTGVSARYRELSRRTDFYLAPLAICPDDSASAARDRREIRRLLYIGNLGSGYRLEPVFEALVRDPSLEIDLAGAGPREMALRALASARGLMDRVRFHGYLSAADLSALAAECDAGLVPMRDDSWVGLPNKLFDYLAAGLPVLSSLHGECGELLVRESLGVTYEGDSAESFLDAVRRLVPGKRNLPESLRADHVYPAYVRFVTSSARTCR